MFDLPTKCDQYSQLYQVYAFLWNISFSLLPVKITLSFILCLERAADKGSYNLFFSDDFSLKMSFKKKKKNNSAAVFLVFYLKNKQVTPRRQTACQGSSCLIPSLGLKKQDFHFFFFLLIVIFSLQSKKSTLEDMHLHPYTHLKTNWHSFGFLERWLVSIQKPQIR